MSKKKFGGFWKRLIAYLIDGLIVIGPFMIITYVFFGTSDLEEVPIIYIVSGLISALYFIILPVTSLQATLGKVVLGMKITNKYYKKISIKQSIGRYFAEILSYITFFIGYLIVAFTKRKTGLHDILAKTYVINKKS